MKKNDENEAMNEKIMREIQEEMESMNKLGENVLLKADLFSDKGRLSDKTEGNFAMNNQKLTHQKESGKTKTVSLPKKINKPKGANRSK